MISTDKNISIGLFAGVLLASMLYFNSQMSSATSPIWSSLSAHFVGLITSGIICTWMYIRNKSKVTTTLKNSSAPPIWAYTCGLFGALVVIVGVNCVNSWIGVTGTIALTIMGQIIFSLFVDHFSLFGAKRKRIQKKEIQGIFMVIIGCVFVLMARN